MQVIDLPAPTFFPQALGFSPDGRLLAVWEESRTAVIDPDGNVRPLGEHTPPNPFRMARNPAVGFTADGRGVVAFHVIKGNTAEIRVYDAESGAIAQTRPSANWSVLAFGPGNRWVYTSTADKEHRIGVVRWDPLTGATLPTFGASKRDLFQIAVSGDARWVVGTIFEAVRVWRFEGDKVPTRASKQLGAEEPGTNTIKTLAVSSDGAFVAAASQGVYVWDVKTGERQTVSPTGGHRGRGVAFHPTKPLLAFSGGTEEVTLWDAAGRSEVKRFAWGVGKVTALAFSPDGLRCAAASSGRVVIWDTDV